MGIMVKSLLWVMQDFISSTVVFYSRVPLRILFYKGAALYWITFTRDRNLENYLFRVWG